MPVYIRQFDSTLAREHSSPITPNEPSSILRRLLVHVNLLIRHVIFHAPPPPLVFLIDECQRIHLSLSSMFFLRLTIRSQPTKDR